MVDFKTAGESHGKGLMVIIDDIPAGIEVDVEKIDQMLYRRQGGYGRGGRMDIEADSVEIYSGIRGGRTLGSPVSFIIHNRDWENWKEVMSPKKSDITEKDSITLKRDDRKKEIAPHVTQPRPGHGDLAGILKYNLDDVRSILERASARETAARTAAGGFLKNFLSYFEIDIISHVLQIGSVQAPEVNVEGKEDFTALKDRVLESPVNCFDRESEQKMMELIDQAKQEGDTLGGKIEIQTTPLPVGLGSHTFWKERLDARLAAAMMGIPAVKGVEIGPAFRNAGRWGSEVHDEIFYEKEKGYFRKSNRAGGLEAGITNGEPLKISIAMKPLSTLYKPLRSVDIKTKEPFDAAVERSDTTAVPACGVVAEAMTAFILSQGLQKKFGGDHIEEVIRNYHNYQAGIPGEKSP